MDVISFLCVSLGSSTIQLHDSLGNERACACSETGFCSRNGDRVWTVYYRRAAFCCSFFCGQKESMQRIFVTYGGKCLWRKGTHNWVANVLLMMKGLKRGWLRQQSKDFCGAGFDALVKRWDKCISVGGGYVEKYMFLPGSNITCCTFYMDLWPVYWLSHIIMINANW
jgi:hypothetical protein